MLRTILASAAVVGLTAGAAVAQSLPPAGNLSPGAPLATDPYSGEGVVVGDETPGMIRGGVVERRPALIPRERGVIVAEEPRFGPAFGLTPGAPTGEDTEQGQRDVFGSWR